MDEALYDTATDPTAVQPATDATYARDCSMLQFEDFFMT